MSWIVLTNNLHDLINSNLSSLGLQESYSFPKGEFTGFPAAHIAPSENSNDYETTSENERVYAFKVRIFDEISDQGLQQALISVMTVADSMQDFIDQENEKTSGMVIDNNLPARYTFINILATPSLWGLTEDERLVINEMTVRVKVSVDVK